MREVCNQLNSHEKTLYRHAIMLLDTEILVELKGPCTEMEAEELQNLYRLSTNCPDCKNRLYHFDDSTSMHFHNFLARLQDRVAY